MASGAMVGKNQYILTMEVWKYESFDPEYCDSRGSGKSIDFLKK
jgi:hypothetical protein